MWRRGEGSKQTIGSLISGRDPCKEAKSGRAGRERTWVGRVILDTVVGKGIAVRSADPRASLQTPTLLVRSPVTVGKFSKC